LDWLRTRHDGRAWLEELPRLVAECAQRWDLRLGRAFPDAYVSLAVEATLPDGTAAVLKVQWPHPESEHEAAALDHWDGDGAVRLLAHDVGRHALLLERCVPGTPLSRVGQEVALDVFTGILPRLWKPAGAPFRSLAEEAARWVESIPTVWTAAERPIERKLVDAAVDALRDLALSQGEQVLIHQDLHADNVLRAERQPWLAIDPKPLAGEREFGVAPIVRSFELGHSRQAVRRRLDRLTDELGLDRERARLWTLGQTLAWAFDSDYLPTHVETVRWLLE
jgi:streptomycin 6-kinase